MDVLSPVEGGLGGLKGAGSSRGQSLALLRGAELSQVLPPAQHLGEEGKVKEQVGAMSCGWHPPCSGGILGTGRTQMPGSETGGGVTILLLGSRQPS